MLFNKHLNCWPHSLTSRWSSKLLNQTKVKKASQSYFSSKKETLWCRSTAYWICMCIADSLCCILQTNTTLWSNCTPIKINLKMTWWSPQKPSPSHSGWSLSGSDKDIHSSLFPWHASFGPLPITSLAFSSLSYCNPWLFHFNVWQNSLQIKKKKDGVCINLLGLP